MIKVLIIEDSYFLASLFTRMLKEGPGLDVVGRADSLDDALSKIELLEPDVVLLDVEMPEGSLDILDQVMSANPVPVIVIGTESDLGRQDLIDAFSYGALDFIIRPKNFLDVDEIKEELIALVGVAASVEIKKLIRPVSEEKVQAPGVSEKLVVIGASSGGVIALEAVITKLPADFPAAVLVVQHMPPGFTRPFAERLDSISDIRVEEAGEDSRLETAKVLIAPGGFNLELYSKEKHLFTRLNKKNTTIKPCIDMALESAAKECGENLIAVILTGMGRDGSQGVKWVKKQGGKTIAQDEKTSLIFGMPKAVIENGDADYVVGLDDIAHKIAQIL